jgi:predicted MFS family arabinose efflux permease
VTAPAPGELATLTAAKTVSNAALRWVGPFLPTLERAFSTSTGTLTGIMGVAELGGLTTTLTGPALDRGHERTVFVAGLAAVAMSSAVALTGSVVTFAISFALLVLGVGNLTIAGHAWIGHRVPFASRSRAIGTFETSWAIALLLGAPALALLIHWFGWRGPYVALLIASAVAAVVVVSVVSPADPARAAAPGGGGAHIRLPRSAWVPMLASAATAATGLGVFIVSGAWLDDVHHVSTGGLGVVAAGFGAAELLSSSAVAVYADRVGVRRSVALGLLLGFEYGFVASLTLVTEAAPDARGRAIGISNSIGTIARAGVVVGSGHLYEAVGISGSLTMATATATLAMGLTLSSARRTG